mmetsp:Transcript_10751/g.29945  ORF Transcript_10751/g.29945 Transcript_10751/m.29945 type:complete len:390 (+) Transcript_10751:2986-4155(+)
MAVPLVHDHHVKGAATAAGHAGYGTDEVAQNACLRLAAGRTDHRYVLELIRLLLLVIPRRLVRHEQAREKGYHLDSKAEEEHPNEYVYLYAAVRWRLEVLSEHAPINSPARVAVLDARRLLLHAGIGAAARDSQAAVVERRGCDGLALAEREAAREGALVRGARHEVEGPSLPEAPAWLERDAVALVELHLVAGLVDLGDVGSRVLRLVAHCLLLLLVIAGRRVGSAEPAGGLGQRPRELAHHLARGRRQTPALGSSILGILGLARVALQLGQVGGVRARRGSLQLVVAVVDIVLVRLVELPPGAPVRQAPGAPCLLARIVQRGRHHKGPRHRPAPHLIGGHPFQLNLELRIAVVHVERDNGLAIGLQALWAWFALLLFDVHALLARPV